ncbi:MAG0920 family protein [Mycoplasmopsis primatum]|uniref:MAG0920 family protein n=1 Tax=Mycoplasmopsis primatum TaxID=55604 RepID=UPI000ACDCB52|nr:hypothetical protein [Mycoplasmopsis primatum]
MYAFGSVNKYCIKRRFRVQNTLVNHYCQMSKIPLFYALLAITLMLASLVLMVFLQIYEKDSFFTMLVTLGIIFYVPLPLWYIIVCLRWYIKQKKWRKFNNLLPDSVLIEKTVDLNTDVEQLYPSKNKYYFKRQGFSAIYFSTFNVQKFKLYSFEKQKLFIYMTMVLNYDDTAFDNKFESLNINMFKDEAKAYKIIE